MAVTLSDIRATQEYKNLLLIGCKDLGAATRSRRPELKINIEHEILGVNVVQRGSSSQIVIGNYTLFQTGYIRLFQSSPLKVLDAVGGDKNYVMNVNEWRSRLNMMFHWLLKEIATKGMGLDNSVYNYVLKNKKTVASKFGYLVTHDPNSFFKWLKDFDEPETTENIIDLVASDITAMINASPAQWVFILKDLYKNPAVARILKMVDPKVSQEFTGDVGLIGDLNDLGISYQV